MEQVTTDLDGIIDVFDLEDARDVYARFVDRKAFIDWIPEMIAIRMKNIAFRNNLLRRAEKLKALVDTELYPPQ